MRLLGRVETSLDAGTQPGVSYEDPRRLPDPKNLITSMRTTTQGATATRIIGGTRFFAFFVRGCAKHSQ